MKKMLFALIFFVSSFEAIASVKLNIINKLKDIENISFDFEQNINGKIENGSCVIKYPKKINCKYDQSNRKLLVSNGKSLVIKTLNSYYIYPLKKTPLNLILDKNFLLKKIKDLKERKIQNKFVNFNFSEKENDINLFFDINTFNLVGWQTVDIYQNVSITYLSAIRRNLKLNESLFLLPREN